MKQKNTKRSKNTASHPRIKKTNSLQWIFEPLERRPDFIQKKMFGCIAAYFDARLILVLADSEDPWNGILIPTERQHHSAIQNEFPTIKPHPVLRKWLYLPQTSADFEETSMRIVNHIQSGDYRFGVDPKPKKLKKVARKK